MWAHLGAMLAHRKAILAHLGAMLAHLGAILAHLGGHVGPSWGYVGPCWPILRHKIRKMRKSGKSTKHRKTREFLATRGGGGGRRQGAAAPLSYGEERNAVRQGHGQGAPGRIFGLTPLVGSAGPLGPPFHRSVGVKVTEWGPASEIYSLGFLEHICWNRRFFGEQVSSRKRMRRVFPKELLPISTCCFV